MVKMESLQQDRRVFIERAGFRHFHPWRVVYKEDSKSTPVRMVVDPTMTSLNLILAKGENKIGSLFDILILNRSYGFAWASDIRKLYNQLQLSDDALSKSLFLYHEALDPSVEPDVYVMLVAWYGVVPTGNQAGYAIEQLVNEAKDELPYAVCRRESWRDVVFL